MFFEGSEKKIEVVVSPKAGSLRDLGKEFWSNIVKYGQAEIISAISNKHVDAYLLSESSLFVWDNTFLMITCGKTVLIDAAFAFMKKVKPNQIDSFIFQRKNEYFGHLQKSNFFDDVKKLNQVVDGVSYRFGEMDLHHNYLFHLCSPFKPQEEDKTVELLMYHIDADATAILRKKNQQKESVRSFLKLDKIIADFEIDDFVFDPFGYSLNAIRENNYLTIHITPQDEGSYISLETNLNVDVGKYRGLVEHFLNIFHPQSFDLIRFNIEDNFVSTDDYVCIQKNHQQLDCGYSVKFTQYVKELKAERKATKIFGENNGK